MADKNTRMEANIKFNTRYVDGAGLADGKRLWSYLRRYGKVTKEIMPSHHIDQLTDALLPHGEQIHQRQLDSGFPEQQKLQQRRKEKWQKLHRFFQQLNKGKKKKKGVVPAGGMKSKMKDDLADYGEFDGGYVQDYEDFM